MTDSIEVLLVDDSEDDRELCRRSLRRVSRWAVSVSEAENGDEALVHLRNNAVDIVLLDYSMPGQTGLDVLSDIALRFPDTSIVMMTGAGNERIAVEALKNGAQDYITKSEIGPEPLREVISRALESKQKEQEILRHAYFDELTGLANRRLFEERLTHMLALAGRNNGRFSIAFFDLDGFKAINDTHGHDTGDQVLTAVAERLNRRIEEGDLLARIGGDEFAALIGGASIQGPDGADKVVRGFIKEIDDEPFVIDGNVLNVGLSCGMAVYPDMAGNRKDLLHAADQFMYQMKRERRGDDRSCPSDDTPTISMLSGTG